jgi:hypothetical protein
MEFSIDSLSTDLPLDDYKSEYIKYKNEYETCQRELDQLKEQHQKLTNEWIQKTNKAIEKVTKIQKQNVEVSLITCYLFIYLYLLICEMSVHLSARFV